ncbi:zinc finger BED domain-containing protein 1 [Notolabrus celidotus]|uniref:zinc finger BED domain-containing protein 1 n=1 Tax=Notolabrus celidotus TaxID=1203425 RepID=UPI00148FAA06|nr:zinc finger BED domain-containing protein 1 [Notolabrus celidotus]
MSTYRRPNMKRTRNTHKVLPPRREFIRQRGAGNLEVLTMKRRLLRLIVSTPQPLETAESEGFWNFVTAFTPSLEIPTKSVIRTQLLSVYKEKKDELRSILPSADNMVLTCEAWSYRAEDSFLTVSCHFVDNLGKLRSYMLSTICLFGDQSADNIENHLCAIMEDWGLKEKVHCVVSAILPKLKGVRKNWMDMPCFADTVDMIFKDLMREDELSGVFRKCQNMVRFFKLDPEAEEKLREIQIKLNKIEGELSLSCGDHWLLWLDMLEGLIKQSDTMGMVCAQKMKTDLILDKNDTEKVKSIISALTPLKTAMSIMERRGFQSVSVVLPLLRTFMGGLKEEEERGNHVAKMLLSKCKKEFGNISNHSMAVFTFLDPRYKNKLGEQNKAGAVKKIRQELIEFQTPCSAADLDDLLARYMAYTPTSDTSNPFAWWRHTGKTMFGGLSMLALKKLGVVSTAVPLERAFSGAGERFCNQRSAIELENLNMILFLNSNWPAMSQKQPSGCL